MKGSVSICTGVHDQVKIKSMQYLSAQYGHACALTKVHRAGGESHLQVQPLHCLQSLEPKGWVGVLYWGHWMLHYLCCLVLMHPLYVMHWLLQC